MEAKLLEIFYLIFLNGLSQSLYVGEECDDTTTSDLESAQSHLEM